jgi:hypothetical protein
MLKLAVHVVTSGLQRVEVSYSSIRLLAVDIDIFGIVVYFCINWCA